MRVKNWLSHLLKSFCVYINRANRRRMAKRTVNSFKALRPAITSAALAPALICSVAQADEPILPLGANPTGPGPESIAVADFNGDGISDLATTNFLLDGTPQNSVTVMLGEGDGFFATPCTFSPDNPQRSIVAGDFNGDGLDDLATLSPYHINLLVSTGEGSFKESIVPVPLHNYEILIAMTTSDFNGDGFAYLAVTTYQGYNVHVLQGLGDGTFESTSTFPAGHSPVDIVATDFNNDGFVDLAVTNQVTGRVSVFNGDGDGTFQAQPSIPLFRYANQLVAGDFDGDSFADLAITTNSLDYSTPGVQVLLGNGDGSFEFGKLSLFESFDDRAFGISSEDFNQDGFDDLSIAFRVKDTVEIWLADGDGGFAEPSIVSAGRGPEALLAQDVDLDGITDLTIANRDSSDVVLRRGLGDGSFEDPVNLFEFDTVAVGASPQFMTSSDVNGDGLPDLLVANTSENNIGVLLGSDDQPFTNQAIFQVESLPPSLTVNDFDLDGFSDFAAPNSTGNISLFFGVGDGTITAGDAFPFASSMYASASGDFDSDGIPDLAATRTSVFDEVGIAFGTGDGSFGPVVFYDVGDEPESIISGDFNGDNVIDLITTNATDNDISVLLGFGDGTFETAVSYSVGGRPTGVTAADFDQDGIVDLGTSNGNDDNVSILLGLGAGAFSPQETFDVGSSPCSIGAADLNGDGVIDLATANFSGDGFSMMLGKGDGTFFPAVNYKVENCDGPVAIVVKDLNGDGRVDLATANQNSDNISIIWNQFACTIIIGDVNQDGQVDLKDIQPFVQLLVAGQFLAEADINGDGKLDLLDINPFVDLLTNG